MNVKKKLRIKPFTYKVRHSRIISTNLVYKLLSILRSAVRDEDDSTNDENNQQKDERRHMMDSTRLKPTPRTPRYVFVFLF